MQYVLILQLSVSPYLNTVPSSLVSSIVNNVFVMGLLKCY